MNESIEMEAQKTLNKTQLEILKMFSAELEENDLIETKRLFRNYLINKAKNLADEVWEEKGWTQDYAEELSRKHMRVSSKNK